MENLFAAIELTDSSYEISFGGTSSGSAQHELSLCRKTTQLGEIEIDQFWLATNSLYGQRNQTAVNQSPLVDLWWDWCGRGGTQNTLGIQQTYLLAQILPHARANGSRRVLQDSTINSPERWLQRQDWINALNPLVEAGRNEEMDEVAFQRFTGGMIGPPQYEASVRARYNEMEAELFEDAQRECQRGGDAIGTVLAKWRRMMNTIGRRRGNETGKQVLDILSYECRAALHRCYSAVWMFLLRAITQRFGLSTASCDFHRLWHFDHCAESEECEDANFHLFHGHVFALHPACGPLLATQAGSEIFGDCLQSRTLAAYRRVLNAIGIAVAYYSDQYDLQRTGRRGASRTVAVADMDTLEG